jgi:hypothetical protein
MKRAIWILWPSFVVAGVMDALFFTIFDPIEFLAGQWGDISRIGAYSVGFFVFWMFAAGSSTLTCFFQRGADEINRCPLPPPARPEGCPKRTDAGACCQ